MLRCFDYHHACFEIHGIPLIIVEYPHPEGITQLLVFEGLTQHSSHQIMPIEGLKGLKGLFHSLKT